MNTEQDSRFHEWTLFHFLNGGNNLDWEALNWGKHCVVLYGAMAGITRKEKNAKCRETLEEET
jgi:hypothetical protein